MRSEFMNENDESEQLIVRTVSCNALLLPFNTPTVSYEVITVPDGCTSNQRIPPQKPNPEAGKKMWRSRRGKIRSRDPLRPVSLAILAYLQDSRQGRAGFDLGRPKPASIAPYRCEDVGMGKASRARLSLMRLIHPNQATVFFPLFFKKAVSGPV
ncbi:hypothetical protein RRG08_041835 [Elysia crispata]|uniref:Uncharacterized protein n=1 Tax=Elysia crispata TaxID=231223 RepID=A0AAE0Y0W5_9GAST|nr:hypothetical protein RRG08_041835 [Elysia crispata]